MKLRLEVEEARREELSARLQSAGFELTEGTDADYILTENGHYISHIPVRDERGEKLLISVENIVYLEVFGHTVEVVTIEARYQTTDSLRSVLKLLDPEKFIRVSNSAVIAKRQVRKIVPTLTMKFLLTMSSGDRVDVTRSYYNSFKEFFRI